MNNIDEYLPYKLKAGSDDEEDMDFNLYDGLPMPIQDDDFEEEEDVNDPI